MPCLYHEDVTSIISYVHMYHSLWFYVLGVNNLRRELATPRPSYEAHAVTLKLQTVRVDKKNVISQLDFHACNYDFLYILIIIIANSIIQGKSMICSGTQGVSSLLKQLLLLH